MKHTGRVRRIGERDGWVCNGCGETIAERVPSATGPEGKWATVDHLDPEGGDGDENLWLMCNLCNASKGNKTVEEWEKTLDFDGAFLRRGFTAVPNSILENASLGLGARMSLIALMSFAWNGDPFPGQKRLAAMLGCSVRTVYEYLVELQEAGYVKKSRRGRGQTNVYRLVQKAIIRSASEPPEESSDDTLDDANGDRKQGSGLDRKQGSDKEDEVEEDPPCSPPTPSTDVVIQDARSRAPKTVDRQPVTVEEAETAWEILDRWNQRTGQKLASKDWITKIILRIREHPDLDVADHDAIIANNLADPWWKGTATPSVVYGNGATFEKAMLVKGSSTTEAFDVARDEIRRIRGEDA